MPVKLLSNSKIYQKLYTIENLLSANLKSTSKDLVVESLDFLGGFRVNKDCLYTWCMVFVFSKKLFFLKTFPYKSIYFLKANEIVYQMQSIKDIMQKVSKNYKALKNMMLDNF